MYKYLSTRLCMYALAGMDETINVNYNLTSLIPISSLISSFYMPCKNSSFRTKVANVIVVTYGNLVRTM